MEEDERLLRNAIGARLKLERDRLGLTTDEWGARAGVHRSSAFNYESGARVPDALQLHRMQRDVGFDVQFIVTGTRTPSGAPLPDAERALLERYQAMPPEMRRTVDDVALLAYLAYSARVDYHRCSPTPGASDDTGAYRVDPPRPAVALHEPAPSTPKPKRTPR